MTPGDGSGAFCSNLYFWRKQTILNNAQFFVIFLSIKKTNFKMGLVYYNAKNTVFDSCKVEDARFSESTRVHALSPSSLQVAHCGN